MSKTYTREELAEVLTKHRNWWYGREGGDRANLSEANLREADLSEADLREADLSEADLSEANLRGADLREANLRGANLRGADLREADLSEANLRGADLRGADLSEADLSGANLRGADLLIANWGGTIADYWRVLGAAPAEIAGMRLALVEGRVDGSTYSGDCACLVGTIANLQHISVDSREFAKALQPNSNRPAERFFMGIKKGDTPETNGISKLAVEWLDEFVTTALAVAAARDPIASTGDGADA